MFKQFIRLQYQMGKLTAAQVQAFVTCTPPRLTQTEANEILGA